MADLIESGRIVYLVLLVLVAEGALLAALSRKRKMPISGLLLNLAAAAFLVLGMRAVFTGADWMLAGAWLGAALAAHAGELTLRLRGRPSRDRSRDRRRPHSSR